MTMKEKYDQFMSQIQFRSRWCLCVFWGFTSSHFMEK